MREKTLKAQIGDFYEFVDLREELRLIRNGGKVTVTAMVNL